MHNFLRELAYSPVETGELSWWRRKRRSHRDQSEFTEARTLADSELDAVNGGTKGSGSWLQAVAQSLGQAMDKQAQNVSSVVAR